MHSNQIRRTSGSIVKTILVVLTLTYFCVIMNTYKTNIHKSRSYAYGGLEVIANQHTPAIRLFLYPIIALYSLGSGVIQSAFPAVGENIFQSKVAVVPHVNNAFFCFITINAP